MMLNVYAIRDLRSGYLTPTVDQNDYIAARNFANAIMESLVSIKLTNPEKLEIGSMSKEHAMGFHDSIGKITGGDIVVLIDCRGKIARTTISPSFSAIRRDVYKRQAYEFFCPSQRGS